MERCQLQQNQTVEQAPKRDLIRGKAAAFIIGSTGPLQPLPFISSLCRRVRVSLLDDKYEIAPSGWHWGWETRQRRHAGHYWLMKKQVSGSGPMIQAVRPLLWMPIRSVTRFTAASLDGAYCAFFLWRVLFNHFFSPPSLLCVVNLHPVRLVCCCGDFPNSKSQEPNCILATARHWLIAHE